MSALWLFKSFSLIPSLEKRVREYLSLWAVFLLYKARLGYHVSTAVVQSIEKRHNLTDLTDSGIFSLYYVYKSSDKN